ncbi:hypothetical protein BC938DRAFT_471110 [Jimgerdemannia flammicorona]|uniref:Uncharacterized protein n=1 Tax=Jimgerdemannia flammicorona TaxID=994334 RepID=A0A433Q8S7_9FUNG|nr:hypothetical protein BC938DRAFT_471110 [Jimgerdemannia flammicorona]
MHVEQDVGTANEFALNVDLRDRGPGAAWRCGLSFKNANHIGERGINDCFVILKDVEGFVLREIDALNAENLNCGAGETALVVERIGGNDNEKFPKMGGSEGTNPLKMIPSFRDHRTRQLFLSYAKDWVLIIALILAFFSLDILEPFHRQFSLTDKSLMYPYAEHEKVPTGLLVVSISSDILIHGRDADGVEVLQNQTMYLVVADHAFR